MPRGFSVLDQGVIEGLGIEGILSTRTWAERNRIVNRGPVADRSRTGQVPWRTHIVPHAAGIMDACDDPNYDTIAVQGPTRLAKSEAAIVNPILRDISQGLQVLYVNATFQDCQKMYQDKLLPAILASPNLRRMRPGDKEGGQMLHRIFPNGAILYMAGAGQIPAGFDAPRVYCDEVNKPGYRMKRGDEAGTIYVARERGDAYERGHKLVLVCTVTTPDGEITKQYLAGDQRLYYVPCPWCGTYQVLEFRQDHASLVDGARFPDWDYPHGHIRFDEETPIAAKASAVYICAKCEREVRETHKPWMVRAGLWVRRGCSVAVARAAKAEAGPVYEKPCPESRLPSRFVAREVGEPEAKGFRASFHFNALISLFVSWGRICAQYVDAIKGNDPEALKSFQRSRLAIPSRDQELLDKRGWESAYIRAHATPYYARTLPAGCPATVITMGADPHAAAVYYVFRAWAPDATSWLLEAGVISVHHMKGADDVAKQTAILNALDRLWEAFAEGFDVGTEEEPRAIAVSKGYLDEGWETEAVRSACRMPGRAGLWTPIKGVPGMNKPWRERQKEYHGTINVATFRFKHVLARLVDKKRTLEDGAEKTEPGYWHLHAEPHHDYCHQMAAEEWRPKQHRAGADVEDWEWGLRRGHNNHWWDCEVYATAAAQACGIPVHRVGLGMAQTASAPPPREGMGEPRRPTAEDYRDRSWTIGRGREDAGPKQGRGGWKIGR